MPYSSSSACSSARVCSKNNSKYQKPTTYQITLKQKNGEFRSYGVIQFNSNCGLSILDSNQLANLSKDDILFTSKLGYWKKIYGCDAKKFEAVTLNFDSALNQAGNTGRTGKTIIKGKFNYDLTKISGKYIVKFYNSPEEALANGPEIAEPLKLKFTGKTIT